MKSFKRLYESTERLVQDVNIVNNETLEQVTGALKRVIKKWKSGRQLSNGALFIPVFSLESKEEKYKEIVKQKRAKDYVKFERPDSDELPFTYLSVTILAIDYFAAEKARKKGLDNEYVRTLRNQIDEYHAINKELEDDLKSIRGLVLSGYGLGKKQKEKQFDTSSYLFYIDPKLIDINELSKHFITSNDRYDSVKKRLARECFLKDKNGYFVYDGVPYGTYKTRRMDLDIDEKLKMTNIKRGNKALYEQIMKNVSREVKRTLNESANIDIDSVVTNLLDYIIETYPTDIELIQQNIDTICDTLKSKLQNKGEFKPDISGAKKLQQYFKDIRKYIARDSDLYDDFYDDLYKLSIPSLYKEEINEVINKYGLEPYKLIVAAIHNGIFPALLQRVKTLYYKYGITVEDACEIVSKIYDYAYSLYVKN